MPFTPPRAAEGLLRCALSIEDAEVIAGDLEETARLSIAPRTGFRAARRWYWRQVISIVLTRVLNPAADPSDVHHPKSSTMAILRQDVFYAVRALRKQMAFTTMAIVMLALGIGATVAIFSLANAVILKRLPFADPDRLMLVHLLSPEENGRALGRTIWSYPKYRVFRDNQRAFDSSATFAAWNWNITGSGSPERVDGELVEGSYFGVLGRDSFVGRTFSEEETRAAGSSPLVVLSHRVWILRFGADPQVIGRSIGLNGIPHTIIGVMPAGFRGLTGQADLWVPVTTLPAADLEEKWNHSYYVVARRRAEISPAQAQADVKLLGDLVHAQVGSPGDRPEAPWSATAVPLNEERVDPLIRRSILLLLGAVLSVLLIVCVNLANLTLARALVRQRDVAIRLALGASRSRIVSQFMTESVLLAAVGAVAAVGVAYVLLSAGAALIPDLRTVLPREGAASGLTRVGIGHLGFDAATFLFTLLTVIGAATMFGAIPAWRASHGDLTGTIKAGASPGPGQGTGAFFGRHLLIVAETALALVLLTTGGLMAKSVARLQATDLGFKPTSVLSARLVLPGPQYNGERATQFLEQLVGRLASRGDLEAVAYGSCAPVQGGCNGTTATFPDRPAMPGAAKPPVGVLWASPEYFDTLGVRVVRGRVFTDHDRAGQPKVVVMNDTAARVFWPGEDPIGKRIAVGQGGFGDGAEVVGVVADVRYGMVDRPVGPEVYLPLLQSRRAFGVIFVKSEASTASVVAAVRSEVRALDPDLPLTDIRTMEERVSEATWRPRTSAWLLGAFAVLALLLVALGVYAVVSQGVQQRTREIGVRIAMGATPRNILRLIVGRVFIIAAAGILIGVALAVPSAKLLVALLYQVRPADPWVFAPVALVLLTVAVVAGYIPARRATLLDPLATLRAE